MRSKNFSLIFIILLLILFTLLFTIRKKQKKGEVNFNKVNYYSSLTFFSMDTVVEIKYKGKLPVVEKRIKSEFGRIYKKFSPSVKTSIVSLINKSGGKIKIDKETAYLIKKSIIFSKKSRGVFDITIKPVIDLWGFEKEEKKVPAKDELEKALKFVSYEKIKLSDGFLEIPEGFEIDLGGIAKGYAVDRCAEIFMKSGVKDFLINAGGDLIVRGVNDKGKRWVVGIQNPRGGGIIKVFSVKNRAVATSGDYQRYFIKDGIRYCHILSPFTGYPFRYWISMTVIAEDCTTADALSTAFFGMDYKEIEEFLKLNREYKNIKFYGVDSKMKVFTNFD